MYRIKIYTMQITEQLEKRLEQFPLPENAKQITGISISADVYPQGVKSKTNVAVGTITLAIPETGDVFYNEIVMTQLVSGSWEKRKINPSAFKIRQWFRSIEYSPRRVQLTDTTFFTAYYEDLVNGVGREAVSYKVRIYLHYTI